MRLLQTLRWKCLDHFVIVDRRHANLMVLTFVSWYHRARPRQGMRNSLPSQSLAIAERQQPQLNDVVCTSLLGRLLNSYHRRAA